MVAKTLQKLSSQGTYLAKEAAGFSQWGVTAGLVAGWLAWPALTPAFKEETLGIRTAPAPGSAAATAQFQPSGKYKYVRGEIGERPTLEEE